jgi:hypothetical protein
MEMIGQMHVPVTVLRDPGGFLCLRASVDITVKKEISARIEVRFPDLPGRSLTTIPTELQLLRSAQTHEQTGNQKKNEKRKYFCIAKFVLASYNSIGFPP